MLNKIEIDVMQANELAEATSLTVKHKLPAMVVHQDLAAEAYIARNTYNGQFKIITPVDWPHGRIYGPHKIRNISVDALEVEGFELLLTGNKSLVDTKKELKDLTSFIRDYISLTVEIRFILGTQINTPDNIKIMCEALQDIRTPNYIRNDTQLKLQVSKANPDIHNNMMKLIHEFVRIPLKISGNVNSLRVLTACSAQRFAVSLTQAKAIIKEFQQQPSDKLRELLIDKSN